MGCLTTLHHNRHAPTARPSRRLARPARAAVSVGHRRAHRYSRRVKQNLERGSSVVELLTQATSGVVDAEGEEWSIGWSVPEYRSGTPIVSGPGGPKTMTPQALEAFAQAVSRIQRESSIKEKWSTEDFWGLMAGMVAYAASRPDPRQFIEANLSTIRSRSKSVVAFTLANVAWNGPARVFDDFAVGDLDAGTGKILNDLAAHLARTNDAVSERWVTKRTAESEKVVEIGADRLVFFACHTNGSGMKATRDAERIFSTVIDLCLLLGDATKVTPPLGGGPHNQPGPRGLALDRRVAEKALTPSLGHELGTFFLNAGELSGYESLNWFSADPFPLSSFLDQDFVQEALPAIISGNRGLGRRVSVAARWHSNYFWSAGEDASVLALGVALDSLVGSNAGLPTRTLAERFALLHPDPHQRPSRAALFKEMYSARSSIAHGSRSSKLDDREFIRTMAAEVKWSAHRVLAAEETFGLNTDADFEEMLEGLRWGTTAWPG